jgi:signal transduction histidine kinase/ActR/RegA family two-component response regulator
MEPSLVDPVERRVLVLAPLGKDAELMAVELRRSGLESVVCPNLARMVEEARRGVGVLLIAEEALQGLDGLLCWLSEQPAWSDPPVLLLSGAGSGSLVVAEAMPRLGNVALIERPVRIAALLSGVHSAMRARLRQYQTRSHLLERESAHRRKDQFLATLAHELRNPLAPISNCVALLQRSQESAAIAPICQILERQAKQLVRLVDDLMDVSRITRGKIALRSERFDLAEAVQAAVETVRPQLDAAGHVLSVELPPAPLWVDGDTVRLCQVFSNLLSNAAKYTDAGGRIVLRAARDGDDAVVTVEDNGIGIAADALDAVFDLFAQVDAHDVRARGGLGIGLTLARSLVAMHGGCLTACSEGLGRGSRFTVRLPLADAVAPAPERSEPVPDQVDIAGRRILVVDDNRDAADSLADLLDDRRAFVRVAYDGPTALALSRVFQPEVAILDLGMPGMSGYELAQRLRETSPRPALLIALSGWGQPQDRRDSQQAGFDHHLMKPVELGEVVARIAGADQPALRDAVRG